MFSESVAQKPIMPGERGHEEREELPGLRLARIERRRLREHRPEAAGVRVCPPQQHQPERDEQRRLDREQHADRVDALVDHPHVDAPENEEADELRQRDAESAERRRLRERRHEDREDLVDRLAADPRLDAEPTARHQRAQQRRHVRAERAERRAAIDRKRDAVFRARVRIEHHRDEHDDVAEEDGEDGLPPVHPAADERRREHVSRDAGRHRDPQRGEVPELPRPPLRRHRCEVRVGEATVGRSGHRWLRSKSGARGNENPARLTRHRWRQKLTHDPIAGHFRRSPLSRGARRGTPLQIVGVINAYCAMLAERAGFRALYLSGAGVANASRGLPDLGMTTLDDVLRTCAASPPRARCRCSSTWTPAWDDPAPSPSRELIAAAGAAALPHRGPGGGETLRPSAGQGARRQQRK